ncbi:MAG: hypothetical protein CMI29_10090 [Opitutae bacterium]|nr:hypothetical protein [Opitutae bacterium]
MASSVAIRDQLLGYNVGVQDARLRELATLKPLNPWRTAFVSPRSYAIEHETMELISEHLTIDRPKIEFEVPTYGDLFNAVYVQYDLPPVTQPAVGIRYYQNGVGIAMIEKAELWCKGRLLDEVDQKYIYMNHEVHGTQVDEAVNLTDRVTIPEMALSSSGGLSVTVQIPFFFTRDRHSFLPLHSVREACERLKVRIYLKPMADLVVNLHCSPLGLSHERHRIQCYGRTILLPAEQRGDYMQKRDYLITTVSAFDTHGTPFKDQLIRTDLPIGGSVKNLLFAVADNSRQTVSDISTDLVPFAGNDVRGLVGKFAARSDAVSDYNCFDPTQERFLASVGVPPITFDDGTGADILSVFVSGNHLFTGGGNFANGTANMWNATTGALVRTFSPGTSNVNSVHVSGGYLFTGSSNQTAQMWDVTTGALVRTFSHHGTVYSVFASGDYLFTGAHDGFNHTQNAQMWEIETGNPVHTFIHSQTVNSVHVSGNHLFTASNDKKARMWDITAPYSLEKTFSGHNGSVLSVFVADIEGQTFLFTGSSDNTVKQWNIAAAGNPGVFQNFENGSTVWSVHVVGNHLFTPSGEDAKMFDITTGSLLRTFSGHSSFIVSVFATETHLYTGSLDGTAKKSSLAPPNPLRASSNVLEHRRDGRIGSLMIPGDPFEFRAVDKDTGKEVEPLKSFQLKVDGKSRFHAEAPSYHFRDPAFNRVGRRGVYSYSFAKHPSDPHPSGHLNFSRVQDVKVVARASSANDSTLFLFAEKHNILTTDSRVFSVRYSL